MTSNVRHPRGNALALIAATTIVVLLVVGFLVFKVGNLTGGQREAQTAIDAAALQAAKELSNCTVRCSLGTIAAVDLPPEPNTSHPDGAIGINTALATARLDALVATNINNSTMQFLAKRDIDELESARVRGALVTKINQEFAKPEVLQRIKEAYNNNARRGMRNDAELDANSKIAVKLGALTADSTTNLRVPNSSDGALTDAMKSNGFYKAYVNVPIPGVGRNVQFSSIGDQPRIVDNANYRDLAGNDLPTVVRVETDSVVLDRGQDVQGHKSEPKTIHNIATAVAGSDYIAPVSTTYCVSFRGGFPANIAVGSQFDSVANIMNAAVLDLNGSPGASGNGPWSQIPPRTWFRAPGNAPAGTPTSALDPTGFPNGENNIDQSNGSVALAFGMYDWMRSLGLRLNAHALVSAFTDNLRNRVPNSPPVGDPIRFSSLFMPAAYAAGDQTNSQNSCWLAVGPGANDPRYQGLFSMTGDPSSPGAQMIASSFGYRMADAVCPAAAAATVVNDDGAKTTNGNDIADLGNLQNCNVKTNHCGECVRDAATQVESEKTTEANNLRAQADAHNAQAAQAESDAQSLRSEANALRTAANSVVPPNQSQLAQADAKDAQAAQKDSQASALRTQANDEATRSAAARVIAERAAKIKANGLMAVSQTYNIQLNFQPLTALGVSKSNDQNFTLAGSPFAAAMKAGSANADAFLNHPTGDQINAFKAVIIASTSDDDPNLANGNGQQWSKLNWKVYTHATAPTISHNNNPMGMPVALAQAAAPPNNNLMFLFNIQGNYQNNGEGTVTITPLPLSPFIQNPIAHGQCYYEATGSLTINVNSVPISFTCRARDNLAVGEQIDPQVNQARAFSTPQGSNPQGARYCHGGTFNMDLPDNGGNDCPTLGGEWQLTCPIPGGCVQTQNVQSNGNLIVTPCPPPPPQMG